MTYRIPLSKPDLSGNEEQYAIEAIRSTWISSQGEFLDRFEREFSSLVGGSAVAVSSGTSALHLAMLALDVRPGDEVLTPSLTYVAVANAVRYVGAEPVFIDIDSKTWCIDPTLLERAITRRTRGIIAVHSYGHPADMHQINDVADAYGLWVVDDAAEAHGAFYGSKPVGSLGTLGVFSFYGNKILTSGEGGAVVVPHGRKQLEQRVRQLRGQGMADTARRYFFPVVGHNFRMTNVQAAILCAQIERSEQLLAERRRVCSRYIANLGELEQVRVQQTAPWATTSPWLFSMLIKQWPQSSRVAKVLAENGVETRPFFRPLHTLPQYREQAAARGDRLPITEEIAEQGISLPTYPGLTDDNVDEICGYVRSTLGCEPLPTQASIKSQAG